MGNTRERYIVDEGGKRTAIVLPMTAYKRLLEDIHDLAVIAERRDEPTLPLEEVRLRLQADGLLPD